MTQQHQPPQLNEIEVSLFGPGYGECVVAHLGASEWMIVDSCIDSSGEPAGLKYLKGLGLDPRQNVKWVLATHWHDDHVRGLSAVMRECESAQFACSFALQQKEFLRLVAATGERSMMATSGVDEFSKVFTLLQDRKANGNSHAAPLWAVESRLLWRRLEGIEFEVHALSPSDASISLALVRLGALVPKLGVPKRRIASLTPNHASVALWIRAGQRRVLLGADLEETDDAGRGWSAVLSCSTRPHGKASVFKISHHGSHTAEHPQIWTDLLEADPASILTPFTRGNIRLPTGPDVDRIRSRSKRAFITAPTHSAGALPRRPPMVSKTIRETVKNIRPVHISPGHIRLRARADTATGNSWSVELFRGAVSIHESL